MGIEGSKARERAIRFIRGGPAGVLARSRQGTEPRESRVRHEGASDAPGWPALPIHTVPLIVAGVGDAELDGHHLTARQVKVRGLHRVLRSRDPPFVVVLGDEALQRLTPSVLSCYLKQPGCISFGCARTCPAHVVADWAHRCPIEFVPDGHLSKRIAVACRLSNADPADEELAPGPCRRREKMRKALLALQRTGIFQVKPWAGALGMTRHALKRLCITTIGLPPEEIAWAFHQVRVRREVLRGRSDAEIARSLGLANAYTLRRAYALRGLPYPGA